jgi:hypothetical protein
MVLEPSPLTSPYRHARATKPQRPAPPRVSPRACNNLPFLSPPGVPPRLPCSRVRARRAPGTPATATCATLGRLNEPARLPAPQLAVLTRVPRSSSRITRLKPQSSQAQMVSLPTRTLSEKEADGAQPLMNSIFFCFEDELLGAGMSSSKLDSGLPLGLSCGAPAWQAHKARMPSALGRGGARAGWRRAPGPARPRPPS